MQEPVAARLLHGKRHPGQREIVLERSVAVKVRDHLAFGIVENFGIHATHRLAHALPLGIVDVAGRPGALARLARHAVHRNHPPFGVPLVGMRSIRHQVARSIVIVTDVGDPAAVV